MGGIDPLTFEIEFMERTQSIIRSYHGEYEFTLLMNCLLGLIVLTYERINHSTPKPFKVLIDDFDELRSVISAPDFTFSPVTKSGPQPRTLANFIKRMRNSIAHATVYPESAVVSPGSPKEWVAVFFECENIYVKGNPLELDVRFEFNQLKEFAIAISTLYQKTFLGL
jgi:hypothetical protein